MTEDFTSLMVTKMTRAEISPEYCIFVNTLNDVQDRQNRCWWKVIEDEINIPAHSVKLFDSHDNVTSRLVYSENTVTHQSTHACGPHSTPFVTHGPDGASPLTQGDLFPKAQANFSLSLSETTLSRLSRASTLTHGAHSLTCQWRFQVEPTEGPE